MAAENAAATIGQQAAASWFGAGVDNAKSYLQGVEAAFDLAQTRLKAKGLKLADIKGISAGFSDAIARPQVQSVIPMSAPPLGQGTAAGGGAGAITVNVNGGLSTSAEIGRAVVDAIRQFNQVSGPANIRVA